MSFTLVTGSASGIGAATLLALKAQGRKVLGADISQADICVDLSTSHGRESLVLQTRDLCVSRLDGLVLCAGLGPNAQPASKITAVNYFGTVAILDGLLPLLRSGVNAAAVVVSSIASVQMPWHRNPLAAALKSGNESEVERLLDRIAQKASLVAYCASKNALTVAVRQRARAWGQAGVRLNTVAPGSVDTPMQQATLTDPELTKSIHQNVAPLGRIAQSEEIADLIAFLLSSRSSYVHGAQWIIDGGKDAMIRSTQF